MRVPFNPADGHAHPGSLGFLASPYSCRASESESYRCYDLSFRTRECCSFCEKHEGDYPPGCRFGDKRSFCYHSIRQARDCYRHESNCCGSCTKMEKAMSTQVRNIPDCKYGDREDCSRIRASQCYDTNMRRRCCERCVTLKFSNQPKDCEYGDREDCSRIGASECYDSNMKRRCCSRCETLKLPNQPTGCEWGDRLKNCSCERNTDAQDPRCCYSCGTQLLVVDASCNDTASWCQNIAANPWMCYRGGDHTCCYSCALQENRVKAQLSTVPSSCKYGDKAIWCTDPSSGMRRRKSRCYSKYNNENCCLSCFQLREDVPSCEYGDRWESCRTMKASECYYRPREEACCQRCSAVKENMRRAGVDVSRCPYGDRVSWCAAQYCDSRPDLCCATCP